MFEAPSQGFHVMLLGPLRLHASPSSGEDPMWLIPISASVNMMSVFSFTLQQVGQDRASGELWNP